MNNQVLRVTWPKIVLALVLLTVAATGCFGGQRTTPGWSGLAAQGDGVFFASPTGKLFRVDAVSGMERWHYPVDEKATIGQFYAEPVVAGELLLTGSGDHILYALNAESGQLRWKFQAEGAIIAAVAVLEDTVFVASADNMLYAVDLENGVREWEFKTENWNWAPPLIADGRLYLASMDHRFYCLDASSGEKLWDELIGAAMASAPSYADGIVYFGALDSKLYALDAATGARRWVFEVEPKPFLSWELPAGRWLWGQPLLVDGVVYVGSLVGSVYAIDAAGGELLWQHDVEGPVRAGVVHDAGILYVSTDTGNLHAVDIESRQDRWVFKADASILARPVISGEVIVIGTAQGTLTAVDVFGNQRWQFAP